MVGDSINRELSNEFSNVIIRASAGTGKTFALSNRYLRLLASGVECQTILATTFTRKGAGEILDRIMDRLSEAALDKRAAAKLSKELSWKLSQKRAAEVLHNLLRNLHRLEISTLDSFFNRIAKAFSLELGLPPSWQIVEEQHMKRLYDAAIQSVLQDASVISLLHMLSKGEAARRVATMVNETVQHVYAVYRESGPEPWDQLPTTGRFLTDEQLELVLAKIENMELPGKALPKHWLEVTKHAANGDWAEFASTASFQNVLDGKNKYGSANLTPEIVEVYRQLLPHCIAFIEQRLIQQNHSTRDLLMAFGTLLDEAKNETGNLRFDDVTQRLQQFVSKWDTDRFSFRLDHQIQHLLLDEFQDTSLTQWNVIRPFAMQVTASQDKLRSFFCVGDMKQAIYGWRGGVAEIFDLVDSELPNLDEPETLTHSYRSAQPVIDLVNQVFLHVDQYQCNDEISETAIRHWSHWFAPHSTERNELAGYVTIEMAADCDDSLKQFELSKDSSRNENVIRKTIERIQDLSNQLPADKSIGLIVRTNHEVGRLIFRLQQAGVPASEEGGNPVTDSAAVELILSALTLADQPGDSLARFHLSHSPLADSLGLIPETGANQNENADAAISAAANLRRRLVTEGYGPTVESLARLLFDDCTQRELIRLQQLVQVAYTNAENQDLWQLRPQRFVNFVREDVKVSDQSSAQVRVMTIHKAKGLEFDVVVLPIPVTSSGWAGMTPNVVVGRERPTSPINVATRYAGEKIRKFLPADFQRLFEEDRRRNVREAMCVLYVSLTRAAQAVHVIVSHGAKPNHKSTAGILLATVCPDVERKEGLLHQQGDPNWFANNVAGTSKRHARGKPNSRMFLPDQIELKPHAILPELRSGRGIARTSPSSLEGGNRITIARIFGSADDRTARLRGLQLHACFELVSWLDQSVPTKKQLHDHLAQRDPTTTEFGQAIELFYESIDRPQVRHLLSRQSYQEMFLMQFSANGSLMLEAHRLVVETERRFAVSWNAGIVQGTIDRLILIYEGDQLVAADVIDFKTDAITTDSDTRSDSNLQRRVEYYRPQLASYREAVSNFTRLPLEKIAARLLFVQSGDLVNLDLVESASSPALALQFAKPTRKKAIVESAGGKTPQKSVPSKKRKSKSPSENQQRFWTDE